jgi:hypothetical protein
MGNMGLFLNHHYDGRCYVPQSSTFFQIYDKDVSSVVLLLWIFVVYDRKLWVLAFMGLLLLGEIAAVATILAMSFSNFHGAL